MTPSLRRLAGGLVLATILAACGGSDDDGTGPSGTDLSGTYDLQSFQQPPNPTLAPPIVSGTITLTSTRYTVTINLPPGSPTPVIQDAGTYTTSGNNITQTSDGAFGQSVGTFSLQNGILTTDLTSIAGRVITTWKKR
ncbi:MAG TPA: hypothetical protein VLL51_11365 [Gemmatimonadales bacterium]|nr:hypothetical protein [Gemmatimonadales bacterium]